MEQTLNKLKAPRAVVIRTDQRADIHAATATVAALRTWLRGLARQDPANRTHQEI